MSVPAKANPLTTGSSVAGTPLTSSDVMRLAEETQAFAFRNLSSMTSLDVSRAEGPLTAGTTVATVDTARQIDVGGGAVEIPWVVADSAYKTTFAIIAYATTHNYPYQWRLLAATDVTSPTTVTGDWSRASRPSGSTTRGDGFIAVPHIGTAICFVESDTVSGTKKFVPQVRVRLDAWPSTYNEAPDVWLLSMVMYDSTRIRAL